MVSCDFMSLEAESLNKTYSLEELQMMGLRYYTIAKYSQNKILLDVGCGQGIGLNYLLNSGTKHIDAIDLDKDNILHSKNNIKTTNYNKINFEQINFLNFKSERKYDVISVMEVLQYIPLDLFLNKCKTLLKPKGIIIASIPNIYRKDKLKQFGLGKYFYSNIQLYDLFQKASFNPRVFGAFKINNFQSHNKLFFKRIISKVIMSIPFGKSLMNIIRVKIFKKIVLSKIIDNNFMLKYNITRLKQTLLSKTKLECDYQLIYIVVQKLYE